MQAPDDAGIVPPTTIEGIAIHIGYLRRDIQNLTGKFEEVSKVYVTHEEFKPVVNTVTELKTFMDNSEGAKTEATKHARWSGGTSGAIVGGLITGLLQLINFIVHK